MKISLAEFLAKLPLPATDKWPHGVWDIPAFTDGALSLLLFAPKTQDYQTPHSQDELYVIVRGKGMLILEEQEIEFEMGDVLYVPAGKGHRFTEFGDDLMTWVVLWGPHRAEGTIVGGRAS